MRGRGGCAHHDRCSHWGQQEGEEVGAEYMVAALDVLERHIAATVIYACGRGDAERDVGRGW